MTPPPGPSRPTISEGLIFALMAYGSWGLFPIYWKLFGQVSFLNPLGSILLARLVLRERLGSRQIIAVAVATGGVILYGWGLGQIPWIALGLAATFGLYGLIRKIVPVGPVVGLLIETAWMTPVALAVVGFLALQEKTSFGTTPGLTALFLGAGFITTIPLMWFHRATKLLPLSLMGILQYLAPTIQLLLGVVVFHEEISSRETLAFSLIWVAIFLYLSGLRRGEISPPTVPNAD